MTGRSNSRMNFLRLSGSEVLRHVLGRDHRALDDQDVELGVEAGLGQLLGALRGDRGGGGDAGVLHLLDARP